MKIGDLDELKEVFRWTENCMLSKKEILDIIDDAKPVEIDESVIQNVLYKRSMTVVSNEYMIALLEENQSLKNQIDALFKVIADLKQNIREYQLKEVN